MEEDTRVTLTHYIQAHAEKKVVLERTDVKVLGASLLYVLLGLIPIFPVIDKRLNMYTSTIDHCTGFKVDTAVVCVGLGTTGLLCAVILTYGYFLRRVIFIRGVGIVMMAFILVFALSGFLVESLLIFALYPFAFYVYKKTDQYKITPFGSFKFNSSVQKHD